MELADGTFMVPTVFTYIHKEKSGFSNQARVSFLNGHLRYKNLYAASDQNPFWGSLENFLINKARAAMATAMVTRVFT